MPKKNQGMENPRTRETGQEENKLYYSYQCLIQCNLHWFIKKKEKRQKKQHCPRRKESICTVIGVKIK